MPYNDINEIIKMVEAREGELKELYDRFEADYKLWRLTEYDGLSKSDYDIYTSSWPRNKADKVTEILGYAPVKISIPQGDDKEKEREDKAKAERLIIASLNIANERLRATIQPTIQEQLAFYAVNRGWVSSRCFVHAEDDEGQALPDIAIWDVLNVSWEVGPKNILWGNHKRSITKAQAKAEYGKDLGDKPVINDFWDEEGYKIIGNKEEIHGDTHGLGYPPIFIGMVGPSPFIQCELADTIKDWGESIFASDRQLIPIMNKLKSYYMTIVGQGVHNPIAIYSSGGKKELEKSPFRKGADVKLDVDKSEKIEPIFKPVMPQEAAALVSMIQQELSMSGAISLLWGIDEAGGSGYRANLLTHAASTILLPRQRLIEQALEWIARQILLQYKNGEFSKTRLRGRDNKGEYFDFELAPTDIQGDWYPEVTLMPRLPEDEASKFAMYEAAVRSEIFSRETAMEKIGVPDTETEKGRIWREKADSVPSITVRKIMRELVEDKRPDLARQVWEEYQKSLGQQGGSGGKPPNMPSNVLPPAEYEAHHLTPDQQKQMNTELKLRQLGLEVGK